jgi:hypothetical protein
VRVRRPAGAGACWVGRVGVREAVAMSRRMAAAQGLHTLLVGIRGWRTRSRHWNVRLQAEQWPPEWQPRGWRERGMGLFLCCGTVDDLTA